MYDWFDFLRVCLFCYKYEPPVDILCNSCWAGYEGLSKRQFTTTSLNYEFPVKRVWVWGKNNNYEIKKVIYSLKGGHSPKVYKKLSLLLLQKIVFEYYNQRQIVFVPAPALKPRKNHALYLSKALSELTGCQTIDLLSLGDGSKKQKKLGIKERKNREFRASTKFSISKKKQIIFIDDVITTGSTARAAFKALGRPAHFEVWVLAERLNVHSRRELKQKVAD